MNIYFDNIIFSLQKAGGISVVWGQLIAKISTFNDNIRFIDYKMSERNIFRKHITFTKNIIIIYRLFNPIISQFVKPKVNFSKPFIFHSSYFRICKNPNAINITTVHDFIYEQGKPNFKQKIRIKLNHNAIRNSEAIVCISENTKKDLLKYLPDIDGNKIHVIYNGVSDDYGIVSEDSKYSKYKDYVLFVGGRQGYKNFSFVVNSLKDTPYKLLICGAPLSKEEMNIIEKNIPNRYDSILYPSNSELNKIYNSVYALAYTSSYEGFGIPVLEAQRAGCPVIALNRSSIPEVIGETPLLMDELSKKSFLEKLNLLKDETTRQKVIETGVINSSRFSWQKMATEYYYLYNKLLENRAQD